MDVPVAAVLLRFVLLRLRFRSGDRDEGNACCGWPANSLLNFGLESEGGRDLHDRDHWQILHGELRFRFRGCSKMFRLVVVHRAPIVRIASYSCSALKILTTGITSANCPLRKPCETCETLRNEKPFCESLQNFYLRKLAKSFAKACEPVVKLRNCDLGGESGTISLLSVKFL